jgi:TetR/AcrR family transcriptional repressor of nem operon
MAPRTMPKADRRNETRNSLLEAGVRIVLERGYNNAGLDAILAEAGVPKGSFYYYFESKEDFGLRIVDHWMTGYADAESALADQTLEPLERVRQFFEARRKRFVANGCRVGCLVGNLTQEMSAQNESFRSYIGAIFDRWLQGMTACLAEAQKAGVVTVRRKAADLAENCLMVWQGALLLGKTRRSVKSVDAFFRLVFEDLLPP